MKQVIDLSAISPPAIVLPVSMEAIIADMKADFLARGAADGVDLTDSLRESDPATKLVQTQAFREGLLAARINASNLANRVAFATGTDLDTLVAFADIERQVIDPGNPAASPPIAATTESDDRLRRRFVLHWNAISNGAPEGFYESLAMDMVPDVFDAYSVSPAPCEITVYVLPRPCADQAACVAAVAAVMANSKKVPQGDRVTVQLATVKPYRIVADLGVASGPDSAVVVQAARAKVQAYAQWSEVYGATPLGRSIEIPFVHAALAVAGVTAITVTEPAGPMACGPSEAALCSEIVLTVNGVAP
ncbi:MAG: baseplate J/gp47 family protein [Magnetospirillum sp.]|nr:baseplate J/gp47 family protein [Magnetospirillum sp.]